jgi:serine/threonine protein kinase
MSHSEQFERELASRAVGFEAPYVIEIINHVSGDWGSEPTVRNEFKRKGMSQFPYCLIMEAGSRSLHEILSKGKIMLDFLSVCYCLIKCVFKIGTYVVIIERLTSASKKEICHVIAEALQHMHSKRYIHGDIKPKVYLTK